MQRNRRRRQGAARVQPELPLWCTIPPSTPIHVAAITRSTISCRLVHVMGCTGGQVTQLGVVSVAGKEVCQFKEVSSSREMLRRKMLQRMYLW